MCSQTIASLVAVAVGVSLREWVTYTFTANDAHSLFTNVLALSELVRCFYFFFYHIPFDTFTLYSLLFTHTHTGTHTHQATLCTCWPNCFGLHTTMKWRFVCHSTSHRLLYAFCLLHYLFLYLGVCLRFFELTSFNICKVEYFPSFLWINYYYNLNIRTFLLLFRSLEDSSEKVLIDASVQRTQVVLCLCVKILYT